MTPEEGLRLQIEAYRRMTPQERLQISFRLYEMTRALARQGVKYQHPDWDEQQVEQEVLRATGQNPLPAAVLGICPAGDLGGLQRCT